MIGYRYFPYEKHAFVDGFASDESGKTRTQTFTNTKQLVSFNNLCIKASTYIYFDENYKLFLKFVSKCVFVNFINLNKMRNSFVVRIIYT